MAPLIVVLEASDRSTMYGSMATMLAITMHVVSGGKPGGDTSEVRR